MQTLQKSKFQKSFFFFFVNDFGTCTNYLYVNLKRVLRQKIIEKCQETDYLPLLCSVNPERSLHFKGKKMKH
jgi:hypothetical protein